MFRWKNDESELTAKLAEFAESNEHIKDFELVKN